ncbi:MAG: hypothetical protein QJR06_08870 [Alicyclobacillaceae bacterium]|nr:hypothetical protein [Alicyclobacillaceae bacterium]
MEDIRRIAREAAAGRPVTVQMLSYGATVKTDNLQTRADIAEALERAGYAVQPVFAEGDALAYHLNVSLPVMH